MDAASNNGVDNIRDIRDEVVYSPSNLKYRVYIIDEVHMLSTSAFNALLKTLEEPPEHVVFILATTELHKLPATIISRCQRFDFRRIATSVLTEHLLRIAKAENIEIDESAAVLLAKHAQGGMRDAISLLDLCAGSRKKIDDELVYATVGSSGRENMLSVVKAIAEKDYDTLFAAVDEVVASSRDIAVFWQDLISVYRDLLVVKTTKNSVEYLDLTDSEIASLTNVAKMFTVERMSYHCGMLEEAYFSMQKANAVKRMIAELTLIRMCDEALETTTEAILSRISQLEDRMATGSFRVEMPSVDQTSEKKSIPEPVEKAESATPKNVPASKPVGGGESMGQSKRVLRPIRAWMEVVERISRSEPMTASFVKTTRAFTTDDGKVIVQFDSDFSLHMMEQGGAKDRLRAASSAVLRREIGDRALIFEVVGRREEGSPIDEIMEAMDEL
jgi:DNA polymerase-3 subunit gamma/tau